MIDFQIKIKENIFFFCLSKWLSLVTIRHTTVITQFEDRHFLQTYLLKLQIYYLWPAKRRTASVINITF